MIFIPFLSKPVKPFGALSGGIFIPTFRVSDYTNIFEKSSNLRAYLNPQEGNENQLENVQIEIYTVLSGQNNGEVILEKRANPLVN